MKNLLLTISILLALTTTAWSYYDCYRPTQNCNYLCDQGKWSGFKYPQYNYCRLMCSNNDRACQRNINRFNNCVNGFESSLNNCIIGARQGASDNDINMCLQITNNNMERCLN